MRDGSTRIAARPRCLPFADEAAAHGGCGAQSALICVLRASFELDLQQAAIYAQRLMRLFGHHHPVVPIADGILHTLDRFGHGLGRGILVVRLGYVASFLRALAEVMQILLIQQRHRVHEAQIILKRKAHSRPMSAMRMERRFAIAAMNCCSASSNAVRVIIERGAERIGSGGATRLQPVRRANAPVRMRGVISTEPVAAAAVASASSAATLSGAVSAAGRKLSASSSRCTSRSRTVPAARRTFFNCRSQRWRASSAALPRSACAGLSRQRL